MSKLKLNMVALLVCAGVANAAIITPTSVTFTGTATELGGLNLDNEANIINGNGLSGVLTDANLYTVTHAPVSFSAPGNAWTTTDPGGFPSDFFASTTATVVFGIDLGGTTSIGRFASWGYYFNGQNGNTIANVTLDFSTDGGTTIDSSQTFAVPLPSSADLASVVELTPTTANYITMTVNDNHFGNPGLEEGGGDRVGLAEIAFSTVVPEPTSVSLMALFGGSVLLIRRKLKV